MGPDVKIPHLMGEFSFVSSHLHIRTLTLWDEDYNFMSLFNLNYLHVGPDSSHNQGLSLQSISLGHNSVNLW